MVIGPCFRVTTEFHVVSNFRPHDFPGISKAQPFIGDLHLPAVADRLVEDSELITDAIADGGHFQ